VRQLAQHRRARGRLLLQRAVDLLDHLPHPLDRLLDPRGAARLLRDPERYIARFGRPAYDVMLGDCFWHIYRMIGKLSSRIYVLQPVSR